MEMYCKIVCFNKKQCAFFNIYTYIYVCICLYIYIYVCVCVCVCVCFESILEQILSFEFQEYHPVKRVHE